MLAIAGIVLSAVVIIKGISIAEAFLLGDL